MPAQRFVLTPPAVSGATYFEILDVELGRVVATIHRDAPNAAKEARDLQSRFANPRPLRPPMGAKG